MSGDKGRLAGLGTAAVLAWVGWVLWRYQSVGSALPLGHVALAALWVSFHTSACLGLGRGISSLLRCTLHDRLDRLVVSLALGAGGLVALAGVLGLVGSLSAVSLLAVLGVAAAAGAWVVARERPWVGPTGRPAQPPGSRLPIAALVAAVIITVLPVSAPSPFYDQLHYHLAFPQLWLESGGLQVWERHAYSYLPANMGLLYTYALAALGPWAAQAVHWWCGAVAAMGVWALARRLGGRSASPWATALFATTPSVVAMATWAIADLGVTCFAMAAALVVIPDVPARAGDPGPGRAALAGLLVGLAVGCKYQALATVAVPSLLMLAVVARTPRRVASRLGLAVACLGAAISPWLIRNAVVTGDPLYPYGAAAVAALGDHGDLEGARQAARGIGVIEVGRWRLGEVLTLGTFTPAGAAGEIGPCHLALGPLVLWILWTRPRRPLLAVAAAVALGIGLWGLMPHLGRYLVPLLALSSALGGLAMAAVVDRWRGAARRSVLVLAGVVLAWNLHGGVSALTFERAAAVLGRGTVDAYMERYVTYWRALPYLNHSLPAGSRVLLVGESRTLFMECDLLFEDPFRTPFLVELAETTSSPEEMAGSLASAGVTHLLINRQEAARIAALNGRQRYLDPPDTATLARLQDFLSDCLSPLYDEGPVVILALRACQP